MNFDFNKSLLNLDGQPVKDHENKEQSAGKLLASGLVNTNKGNALKFFNWAQRLWNCEPINLDKADKKTLIEFIENNETITILGKAQLLEILEQGNE